MHLSINEIKKSYHALKKQALDTYADGKLLDTLVNIDKTADFVQQFNWIYTDDDLERLLSEISHKTLSTPVNYTPQTGRVVLFDDWCTSYVLALQYIEALSLNFEEVLYITARDVSAMPYTNILGRIAQYPNVKAVVIPTNPSRFERSQMILDAVTDFSPSKIFLHIGYNSPVTLALYSIPQQIDRYLINLADQTFWLGSRGIDYTLEFRPFGATVSYEKRGLNKEQLLYLPFYPVRDGNQFQGFPEQATDKVVIFSGGDFYKTLDPNNTYWNLVKEVLNENPEAVFLYATKNIMGKTQEFIDTFVSENNLKNRFIYIGFRPDIDEVFKHCDIFMGTCPVCGSLISQLAAINSKPILQYYLPDTYDDETEQAICHNSNLQISFRDKNALLNEARKLIQDKDHRVKQGEKLYEAMFKPDQFNQRLKEVVNTNYSPAPLKQVDFKVVAERWWWCELLGFYNTLQQLFGLLGKETYLKMFPHMALKYYSNRLIHKLRKK